MADKIFCGNGRMAKTGFGDIPKISFSKDDINKMVQYMTDHNLDWINVEMLEKREKVEGKPTHYIKVDTWKQDQEKQRPQVEEPPQETDDLPF